MCSYLVTVVLPFRTFSMVGDSLSNFKLFPSDDELSDSDETFVPDPHRDKDPPYNPRY
jgi:hypothetical protein